MAMKVKTSIINCLLFIVSVWTPPHLLAAEDFNNSYWVDCGTNEYREGSDFEHNLDRVLESLVRNVSMTGFNTSVEGQNSSSSAYGLLQCRGDLNSSDCQQCASGTKAFLVDKCHNNTSGFVFLNDCFLRYENHNFYNDYNERSEVMNVVCNNNISYSPQSFGNTTEQFLLDTIEKAVQNPRLFATDRVDDVYSDSREIYLLAQCWRDLSPASCRSCLVAGRSKISGSGRLGNSTRACATGAIGARYRSRNCDLHYEIYSFFNTSIISPSSPGESTPKSGRKGSKVLPIVLGVVAAPAGLIVSIGLCKWIRRQRWQRIRLTRGEDREISLSIPEVNQELIFKYHILRDATSNFKEENKLGEGGFGSVYKGVLPDGREVAVKRLKIGSRQGDSEFLNEANLVSRVKHRNLVKLLGCCVQSSERLLVYEYLHNSSLDKFIFDTTKAHSLIWRKRYEIIVGTARGLAYLHEESQIRIIHRDIKASNILLDNKLRPKITDFGLAKLLGEDQSHVSTRVAGTLGYMAPEYALRGQLTEKADVFSFGVLLLEIVSGRKNRGSVQREEFLIEATWRMYKAERALEIIDSTLEGSYSLEEGIRVVKIGLLCTQAASFLRPSMSQVVSMLTSERENIPSPRKPAFVDVDGVGTRDHVKRGKMIEPDRTSSSAATSSTTPSDIHSAAADPSSSILEPR
eukprot:PITA_24522